MIGKPSLLMLTAATAALAIVANAVDAAAPSTKGAPQTRLGSAIETDLGARDASAAQRNRALDVREQAARAAEARLQADIAARQQASPSAEKAADAGAEATGQQYDNLARIYQAMKPARAAIIFEQLDMEVQMQVAQRMRERSTAMILAAMTPKGAATLSMALAHRYVSQAKKKR